MIWLQAWILGLVNVWRKFLLWLATLIFCWTTLTGGQSSKQQTHSQRPGAFTLACLQAVWQGGIKIVEPKPNIWKKKWKNGLVRPIFFVARHCVRRSPKNYIQACRTNQGMQSASFESIFLLNQACSVRDNGHWQKTVLRSCHTTGWLIRGKSIEKTYSNSINCLGSWTLDTLQKTHVQQVYHVKWIPKPPPCQNIFDK